MIIVWAVITIGILAGLLGLGLALAHKKLAVEKDPKIKEIEDALPSANCGACGYPGCSGYASAIVVENVDIDMCPPGGSKLIKVLARLLGKEVSDSGEKMVARIHCTGDLTNSKQKYLYNGITDCNQGINMFGGAKECPYGCIGLGSCVRACPFDAIDINQNMKVTVNESKCTGCNLCVPVCPVNIIKMVPAKSRIYNGCASHDKAGPVKKYCNVGCTACKLCEKACNYDAIHVTNFLADFDYTKCTECNDCAVVCPPQSIVSWIPEAEMSDRAKEALEQEKAMAKAS